MGRCTRVLARATANKSRNFVTGESFHNWRQDQVTYFVTWRLGRGREELDASEAQKLDYIVGNAWKRWPAIGEYPWVWPLDR